MPLGAFSNQFVARAWLSEDLIIEGFFDESLIGPGTVATGPTLTPGAGLDTLTGQPMALGFGILMPPEN